MLLLRIVLLQHLGKGAWKPRAKPKRTHRGSNRQAKGSAGGVTGSGRRGGGGGGGGGGNGRAVRSDGGGASSQQRKRARSRPGEQAAE